MFTLLLTAALFVIARRMFEPRTTSRRVTLGRWFSVFLVESCHGSVCRNTRRWCIHREEYFLFRLSSCCRRTRNDRNHALNWLVSDFLTGGWLCFLLRLNAFGPLRSFDSKAILAVVGVHLALGYMPETGCEYMLSLRSTKEKKHRV